MRVQLLAVRKATEAPPLPAQADPEMAVTAEWCAAMRAARKAQKVSQTTLAKVAVSTARKQNIG